MVVAAPTGTEGCIHLEHSVHDAKGLPDERVVRATNSITIQFEKTGINDCLGRKFNAITGALISQVCLVVPNARATVNLLPLERSRPPAKPISPSRAASYCQSRR